MHIGKILANLRKSEELSQIELAKILNLEKSTIAKYETDKCTPSLEILVQLAKFFEVSVDYLLGLEN